MQWSLSWYDVVWLYAVEYAPYVALFVFVVFAIHDLIKRTLRTRTIVMLCVTLILFGLLRVLAGVI